MRRFLIDPQHFPSRVAEAGGGFGGIGAEGLDIVPPWTVMDSIVEAASSTMM